jgi:hypothetical protein
MNGATASVVAKLIDDVLVKRRRDVQARSSAHLLKVVLHGRSSRSRVHAEIHQNAVSQPLGGQQRR